MRFGRIWRAGNWEYLMGTPALAAQIAMITIGQVTLDEVMLPYMVDSYGNTLYESMPKLLLEGFE